MKNLVFIPLIIILIGLTNTVNASQNVPLTEVDVLTLQKSVQNNLDLPLKFTDVWRYPKLDVLRRKLDAYFCVFRLNDSDKPNGAIIYYVDEKNYISEIKVVNYDNKDSKDTISAIADVFNDLLNSPLIVEKHSFFLITPNVSDNS